MRPRVEVAALLVNPGIIAVLRTDQSDALPEACEVLAAAGITAIEITLTTPGALDLLPGISQRIGSSATVGVGSILNAAACAEAIAAGAEFLVSPVARMEIASRARAADRVVMLGAYSPTEAQLVFEAGVDFVKIFPADTLGPAYIRGLRAPLPHLKIVPTGGIDLSNAAEFFSAGCVAVGVGSSLLSGAILRAREWKELARRAAAFVAIGRAAGKTVK